MTDRALSRNTPLKPGTSLQRKPFPARKEGLGRGEWVRTVPAPVVKSAATRRGRSATGNLVAPPPSEFTPKVKRLVRRRAGNGDPFDAMCEACGICLGQDSGEFQHRAARGAGGCKDEVINGPANCVLLCGSGSLRTGCHGACEDRDPHMGMDAGGFWLEHGTTPEYDPRNVPIMLHGAGGGGATLFLAADGIGLDGSGYLYQRPELELAS